MLAASRLLPAWVSQNGCTSMAVTMWCGNSSRTRRTFCSQEATSFLSPNPGSLTNQPTGNWYLPSSSEISSTSRLQFVWILPWTPWTLPMQMLCPPQHCQQIGKRQSDIRSALQNAQKVEHISLGDIHWKPEQFQTILTTQFGFRLLKKITNPSKKAGFDRNIYWFKKLWVLTLVDTSNNKGLSILRQKVWGCNKHDCFEILTWTPEEGANGLCL